MNQDTTIALVGLIVTMLIQTGGMFYWGGGVRQMLRDHERRLRDVEGVTYKRPVRDSVT